MTRKHLYYIDSCTPCSIMSYTTVEVTEGLQISQVSCARLKFALACAVTSDGSLYTTTAAFSVCLQVQGSTIPFFHMSYTFAQSERDKEREWKDYEGAYDFSDILQVVCSNKDYQFRLKQISLSINMKHYKVFGLSINRLMYQSTDGSSLELCLYSGKHDLLIE